MTASSPSSPAPRRPLGARIALGVFVTIAVLVAAAIALFGAWVGTSLAVYRNGPVWLVILGAIACFFLVPLAWELWADRHQKGGRIRDAILRSSFLSLTFVVVLLATHPKLAFEALATRGDWFLGGSRSALAEDVRRVLHTAADGLEWLNDLVREKAFRLDDDDPDAIAAREAQPEPSSGGTTSSTTTASTTSTSSASPPAVEPSSSSRPPADPDGREAALPIVGTDLTWPLPPYPHPIVQMMPPEAKTSIAAVGKYLKANVADPVMRVKAIHDFVATWVAYDAVGLADGSYERPGRQEAATVFANRKGVCEGYARLVAALARATGDKVVFVSGDARSPSDYEALARDTLPAEGVGHAWNAAEIEGRWYLLDATWDAGTVDGTTFAPAYRTEYLFTPPEIMAVTHRPDAPRYQLLTEPLSRGDWLRQPLLRPEAWRFGVELEDPRTPIVEADGELVVRLANPGRNWVMADLRALGSEHPFEGACGHSTNDPQVTLRCRIPWMAASKPTSSRGRAATMPRMRPWSATWSTERNVDQR